MSDSRLDMSARRARRTRERSLTLVADARRRLSTHPRRALARERGRLWLNGRELGSPDASVAHLRATYD